MKEDFITLEKTSKIKTYSAYFANCFVCAHGFDFGPDSVEIVDQL